MPMSRVALRLSVVVLVGGLSAGCKTQVTRTGEYRPAQSDPLPKPRRVLVADFSVAPEAVKLDQGVGPRMLRMVNASATTDPAAESVQAAISTTMLENLTKMGLPAVRVERGTRVAPEEVLIDGQIVKIDEGNRTRRMALGFGAGKSTVEADAQIYYGQRGGSPQLLQTYDADANSGRKPGMGVGEASAIRGGSAAPGALSSAAGVHSEAQGVIGEGQHLADRLSYNLGEYFVQQGWIAASSVPPPPLR
jgi:Domain of unknown function (DUF4410)